MVYQETNRVIITSDHALRTDLYEFVGWGCNLCTDWQKSPNTDFIDALNTFGQHNNAAHKTTVQAHLTRVYSRIPSNSYSIK